MYALALNCIRDDEDILNEGLGSLKQTLSIKNEHYQKLLNFSYLKMTKTLRSNQ